MDVDDWYFGDRVNNIIKIMIVTGCFGVCVLSPSSFAAPNYSTSPAGSYQNPLEGTVVHTPIGITTTITTSVPISSETLDRGAQVSGILPNALTYKGQVVAPVGSVVSGMVSTIKKAGKMGKNAQVGVRFTTITTPQGFRIPVSAIFKTDDKTGILKADPKTDKNGAIEILANTRLEIVFDQPITVGAPNGYDY